VAVAPMVMSEAIHTLLAQRAPFEKWPLGRQLELVRNVGTPRRLLSLENVFRNQVNLDHAWSILATHVLHEDLARYRPAFLRHWLPLVAVVRTAIVNLVIDSISHTPIKLVNDSSRVTIRPSVVRSDTLAILLSSDASAWIPLTEPFSVDLGTYQSSIEPRTAAGDALPLNAFGQDEPDDVFRLAVYTPLSKLLLGHHLVPTGPPEFIRPFKLHPMDLMFEVIDGDGTMSITGLVSSTRRLADFIVLDELRKQTLTYDSSKLQVSRIASSPIQTELLFLSRYIDGPDRETIRLIADMALGLEPLANHRRLVERIEKGDYWDKERSIVKF